MSNELFQEAAQDYLVGEAVALLRDYTIATKVFPQAPIKAEDSTYSYYKPTEQDNSQTNLEQSTPHYSEWITSKQTVPIPYHQVDIQYTRHQWARRGRDVFNQDDAKRACVAQLNAKVEICMWAGNTARGIPSIATTGTNSTDMTTSINTTTFALAVNTFETAIIEARTDLKQVQFDQATKYLVVSEDVMARFQGIFSTVDDTVNILSYFAKRLADVNGSGSSGHEYILSTKYLGSAGGTAATCAVLMCANPEHFVMASGPVEVKVSIDEIDGVRIQWGWRAGPVYKEILALHYDSAVDVTS
jgi:hypothetical protein